MLMWICIHVITEGSLFHSYNFGLIPAESYIFLSHRWPLGGYRAQTEKSHFRGGHRTFKSSNSGVHDVEKCFSDPDKETVNCSTVMPDVMHQIDGRLLLCGLM